MQGSRKSSRQERYFTSSETRTPYKITLDIYSLEDSVADNIGRPGGSTEIILGIWVLESLGNTENYRVVGGSTTSPSISWYVDQAEFEGVYNSIGSQEDFDRELKRLRDLAEEKKSKSVSEAASPVTA